MHGALGGPIAVPARRGDPRSHGRPRAGRYPRRLHRYFGRPFYWTMFEAAGFGADIAAYDAAPSTS
jgi:hypothetical protein